MNSPKIRTNPFNAFKTYKGQSKFDTDYIERHIKKVVKKTGPGDNDYIIVDKVVDIKKNIADFIAVDADSVGLYNMLNQLVRAEGNEAKDKLIAQALDKNGVNIHGCNDFSDAPTSLMEACEKAKELEALYNSLPEKIKQGRTAKEFFSNFNNADINNYFKGIYENISKNATRQDKVAELKPTEKPVVVSKEEK